MRRAVLFLSLVLVAPALASAQEAERLAEAAEVVREMANAPDAGIPNELWERANCVAVIPDLKKAAFMFGGEYGKGVLSCRAANGWSAPAPVRLAKGSWGAQIGVEEIDLVLLFMRRDSVNELLEHEVTLGTGASVAAGPVGRTARAGTDLELEAEILAYSRSQGLFAGVNVAGGTLGPDRDAIAALYDGSTTARDIVQGSVEPPAAASAFMQALGGQPQPVPTTGQTPDVP